MADRLYKIDWVIKQLNNRIQAHYPLLSDKNWSDFNTWQKTSVEAAQGIISGIERRQLEIQQMYTQKYYVNCEFTRRENLKAAKDTVVGNIRPENEPVPEADLTPLDFKTLENKFTTIEAAESFVSIHKGCAYCEEVDLKYLDMAKAIELKDGAGFVCGPCVSHKAIAWNEYVVPNGVRKS